MDKSPPPSSKAAIVISLALASGLFFYQFGWRFLDPTNIGFIFRLGGDLPANYLGWAFLRNEPWSFPLGRISSYFAPLGTYAALTGLNPLCWIPFKLLSPVLPVDFQYSGWWMLSCYWLQIYFGYRLMRLITANVAVQILGAAFFLLSPPLLIRIFVGQDTLCSHWLILASFVLYFENYEANPGGKVILYWSLLIVAACAIFPYFCPMVISLAFAYSIAHLIWSPAARPRFWASLALYPLLVWGAFIVLGYAKGGTAYAVDAGFGVYSLNLNGFINPSEWSAFLPALPYRLGQNIESFHYLGLGIIILSCYAIIQLIIRPPQFDRIKYLLPFIIVLVLFFLYALSNRITLGNIIILKYNLPGPLLRLANMFRGSGRFTWPLFYAILYGSLFCVTALKRKSLLISVLFLCLLIQIADIHRLLYAADFHRTDPVASPLKSPLWQSAATKFNQIIICPPFIQTITKNDDYKYLALYAARNQMSINSGYLCRWPDQEMKLYQERLISSLRRGDLDPRAIYIFADPPDSETLHAFPRWQKCVRVDGYLIYTSDDHFFNGSNRIKIEPIALYDFLKKYENDTILISLKFYVASLILPQNVKEYFYKIGSQLPEVKYRDSYVGVISHGSLISEKLAPDKPVMIELPQGKSLGGGRLARKVELFSAGADSGNKTSIKVGGEDYSRDIFSGLNIVVLNRQGEVVLSTIFSMKTTNTINLVTINDADLNKP